MIKITVHLPDQNPSEFEFEKDIITIGSAEDQDINLPESEALIYPEHLKIIKEDQAYSLLNIQDDPTTLLKGNNFTQNVIQNQDELLIGPIRLTFSIPQDLQVDPSEVQEFSMEEADKLLDEAQGDLKPLKPSISEGDTQLDELLEDLELSVDDLEDLESPKKAEIDTGEFDLNELEALLSEAQAVEGKQETNFSDTSPELSDEELEQMLLEIHGEEQIDEPSDSPQTNTLLSSLKEEENTPEVEESFDIEFLDEIESTPSNPSSADTVEENLDKEELVQEDDEEKAEKEIPLGSQSLSFKDFGEYSNEKAEKIARSQKEEESKKSSAVSIDTKQIASIAAIYVITIFLLSLGLFATYSSIQSSQNHHSKLAARGLSDYALALLHKQLTPGTEKLSDSLRAVLPPQYLNNSEIYHTGSFKVAPYQLQSFYNENKSSFLLIANPQSSLLQSIMPKNTLVLDSENMVLRKTKKIDELQRLLSNSENNLSLVDRSDLDALLDTYPLVYPKELEESSLGFAPPAELSQLFPSAELYIYNAPRYYKFSQILGQELDIFSANPTSLQAFQLLNTKLSKFSKYKQLVLYYSAKEEEAKKAFSLLNSLFKKKDFPIGHLLFNTDSGMIKGANILTKDEVSAEELQEAKDLAATLHALKEAKVEKSKLLGSSSSLSPLDFESHPIYQGVLEALNEREEELEEASQQLMELLKENNKSLDENFDEKQLQANESYRNLNEVANARLSLQLQDIFDKHVSARPKEMLPIFLAAIGENELEDFLPETVAQSIDFFRKKRSSKKDIDGLMQDIEKTSNFLQLHQVVDQMSKFLKPDFFDRTTVFVKTKNHFKKVVLGKVKEFILDSSSKPQQQTLQKKDRNRLEAILQIAEVDQGEELNFYLNEFDQLVKKFYQLPKKETLSILKESDDRLVDQVQDNVFLSENQKERIQQQSIETQEQIQYQEKQITQLKDQVSKVPLSSYQASSSEQQKGVNSRIGQQILIRESLEPPGGNRDQHLLEALNLLKEGTRQNRTLWADILQIRNLLSQTPEYTMRDIIHSDIGFDPKKAPMMSSIRKLSKKYLQEKSKLAEVANDQNRYFANRSLFVSTQKDTLEKMLSIAIQTQDIVQHFQSTLDTYIGKLEFFLLDYQKAKDEGFFTTDQQYHSVMSSRLSLKLKRFKQIKEAFAPTIDQILESARAHQKLAQVELEELQTRTIVDSGNINKLVEMDNEITYPDLASINIAKQIDELLKIKINPIR